MSKYLVVIIVSLFIFWYCICDHIKRCSIKANYYQWCSVSYPLLLSGPYQDHNWQNKITNGVLTILKTCWQVFHVYRFKYLPLHILTRREAGAQKYRYCGTSSTKEGVQWFNTRPFLCHVVQIWSGGQKDLNI